MKKLTLYVASDDERFRNQEDCEEYERILPIWNRVCQFILKRESGCIDYLDGDDEDDNVELGCIDPQIIDFLIMITKDYGGRTKIRSGEKFQLYGHEGSGESILYFVRNIRSLAEIFKAPD